MRDLQGKTVAITGAADGIGRALALELAGRGCRLALADIDTEKLAAIAEAVRARGAEVHEQRLDVAERDQVEAFAQGAIGHFGAVQVVINNAGVALSTNVEAMSWESFEWLMGINFWGVAYGTRAFLPHLIAQPEAHIVNISSIFGIIAPPNQSAYCAAKFAVRGFTEALRHEMALEHPQVNVSCVHPGGIATQIAAKARVEGPGANQRRSEMIERFRAMAITTPDEAARVIVAGILKDAPRILIGKDARRIDVIQRLMPGTYWKLVGRNLGRPAK
jgi:NAD(P)-dependent dehydrogenase (short-subunit alcohol dehydrogenase family)